MNLKNLAGLIVDARLFYHAQGHDPQILRKDVDNASTTTKESEDNAFSFKSRQQLTYACANVVGESIWRNQRMERVPDV